MSVWILVVLRQLTFTGIEFVLELGFNLEDVYNIFSKTDLIQI